MNVCAGKDEECFFEISHLLHNMLRSGGPRMLDCFKFRAKVGFSNSLYLTFSVTACSRERKRELEHLYEKLVK